MHFSFVVFPCGFSRFTCHANAKTNGALHCNELLVQAIWANFKLALASLRICSPFVWALFRSLLLFIFIIIIIIICFVYYAKIHSFAEHLRYLTRHASVQTCWPIETENWRPKPKDRKTRRQKVVQHSWGSKLEAARCVSCSRRDALNAIAALLSLLIGYAPCLGPGLGPGLGLRERRSAWFCWVLLLRYVC